MADAEIKTQVALVQAQVNRLEETQIEIKNDIKELLAAYNYSKGMFVLATAAGGVIVTLLGWISDKFSSLSFKIGS